MKILRTFPQKSKNVKYFGTLLNVPMWVKYLTTDDGGAVFAWEKKPLINLEYFSWHDSESNYGRKRTVATADLEDIDWRETLVEVN